MLLTGLGIAGLVAEGEMTVRNEAVPLAAVIGGAVMMTFGLVYASVRSIVARRGLPLERYRGASPVILLVLATLAANALLVPFADDVMALVEGGEMSAAASVIALTGTQAGLLAVTAVFVAWPGALAGAPSFAGGRVGRSIILGLGWGVAGWIVANIVGVVIALIFEELGIPPGEQFAEQVLSVLHPAIAVLAVVVVAPVAEEIFFRGVVYNAWRREHGRRIATFGSALLFAVIHTSLISLIPIFILGIGLAWLYERTRSLLAAIMMHAAFNAISITLLLLDRYHIIELAP